GEGTALDRVWETSTLPHYSLISGELDCSPLFYYLKQVVARAVYSRYSSRLLVAVRYDLPFRLERSANDISLLIVARGLMYFSPRKSRRYAPLLLLV
ncbi:hypothetical protein, partial [Gardnerella vaginalis]|uniref:hypothetical protein n=1 Tax=Gardnerella vaginalis TaxID=2702 RepID=UPI000CBDF743